MDNCDACDNDPDNDSVQDCLGEWGGSAVEDECGICNGDNSSCVVVWGEVYDIETTTELDFSQQNITGTIPSQIGDLINLTWLSLGRNQFTGEIPSEIWGLTNLTNLYIYEIPNIYPTIPSDIINLSNLAILNLNQMQLTSIPPELGSLTNLTTLRLQNNQLTSIPEEFCNIYSNFEDANTIFQNNSICGELPSCLQGIDIGEQNGCVQDCAGVEGGNNDGYVITLTPYYNISIIITTPNTSTILYATILFTNINTL
jgi:hypothetical protein